MIKHRVFCFLDATQSVEYVFRRYLINGEFDFNRVVEKPAGMKREDLWCKNTWGSMVARVPYQSMNNELVIDTPYPIGQAFWQALSAQVPDVAFEVHSASEVIGELCTAFSLKSGICEPLAIANLEEFACRVWYLDYVDFCSQYRKMKVDSKKSTKKAKKRIYASEIAPVADALSTEIALLLGQEG